MASIWRCWLVVGFPLLTGEAAAFKKVRRNSLGGFRKFNATSGIIATDRYSRLIWLEVLERRRLNTGFPVGVQILHQIRKAA
jgi:hypothetical protein